MPRTSQVRAVFLDAGNTMFTERCSRAAIYTEIANRFGGRAAVGRGWFGGRAAGGRGWFSGTVFPLSKNYLYVLQRVVHPNT